MAFQEIIQNIGAQKFAPVYYLHGEETFFIDKIVEALDEKGAVLQPGEDAFNRTLMYGPETSASQLVNACRSFPVMAQRRLVILKEAHRMPKNEIEKLVPYFSQPVPSTVLVMAFKDRRVGLPKAAITALGKHGGVDLHAKKLYDRDVTQWVERILKTSGLKSEPGIAEILVTNLGLNLNLIENELEKMWVFLKATGQDTLTKAFVFEMINVDKEFNVFELIGALSHRKVFQAHMIIDRLTQNTKIHAPTLVVSNLFRFFHYVALVHRHQLRDPNSIKHKLGVNYFQARDYARASSLYPLGIVYRNLGYIEEVDRTLKGLIPTHTSERHLLKTLVWRLLN
ncbi:MAG: DNA polymerase III subunit delta [Bacteroidota bacterium]